MWLLDCLSTLIMGVATPAVLPPDSTIVSHVRRFAVGRIDSALGTGSFEAWLRNVMGSDSKIAWEVNDCGEGVDGGAHPMPICVTADCRLLPHGRATVMMIVGNTEKGVVGPPQLLW